VFSELRRLEPQRVEGLDIYSTVLWHLQSEVALSTLAQEVTEFDKLSPQVDTAFYSPQIFQSVSLVSPYFSVCLSLVSPDFLMCQYSVPRFFSVSLVSPVARVVLGAVVE